jgi:ubiquitin carboxyl-terminal hydrolase 16/45
VSVPETLDLAPFLAPNRNDYKLVPTSAGYRAPYMDWASPEEGPELEPVMYRLYGEYWLPRHLHRGQVADGDFTALVVHLGTMIGGHYIAYTLVDPEKMFIQAKDMVNAMADMNLKGGATDAALPKVSEGGSQGQKDRRVWCYCSE